MREEKDNIGKISIPDEFLYGIYTLRALDNFPITGERINLYLVKAFLTVKKAACKANRKTGKLPDEKFRYILKAIDILLEETDRNIAKEAFSVYDKIIVDPYHGAAGATLDMNINEVIANTALQVMGRKNGEYDLIDPVADVNLSQNVTSTYPAALKIASINLLREFTDAFSVLQKALEEKEKEFGKVIKLGRTQLQDAAVVTLGQEFGAYAAAIERVRKNIAAGGDSLTSFNLCGNAAGNITESEKEYSTAVNDELKTITGLPLIQAANLMDTVQNTDVFVEVHGLIKTGAVTIIKMCQDMRLLSSGPNGGLGEIILPAVLPDSGVTRGKSNPVILENAIQIAELVKGHDLIITNTVSSGNLESNAFIPLIAHLFLKSIEMFRDSVLNLIEKCIRGIESNEERCSENLLRSSAIAESLVNIFGYDRISKIVQESEEKGISFIDLLKQKKILSEKELIGLISREMGIKSDRHN